MTGPLGRAYVEILPDTRAFNTELKAQFEQTSAVAKESLAGVSRSANETAASASRSMGEVATVTRESMAAASTSATEAAVTTRTAMNETAASTTRSMARVGTSAEEAAVATRTSMERAAASTRHATRAAATESEGMFGRVIASAKSLAAFILPMVAGFAAFEFAKDSITAAGEEAKTLRQTNAVIKSTGEAAHVSARNVEDLADTLSKHTGIVRTDIMQGENLLLTFTKVRNETGKGNDIFNQATKTVLDLSVAMKESAKTASIQLGKALQDPVLGMTALRRVGVSFSKDQITMVKGWVAHGQQLKAQKFILGELTKEFGGSADAQASASSKMHAAIESLQVEIGNKFLPILGKIKTWITNVVVPAIHSLIEQTSKGEGVFAAIGRMFRALMDVLMPLAHELIHLGQDVWPTIQKVLKNVIPYLEATGKWIRMHGTLVRTLAVAVLAFWAAWKGYKILESVGKAFIKLGVAFTASPIGLVIAAVAALVAGFIYAYTHSEKFRKIVDDVGRTIKRVYGDIVTAITHAWDNVRHAWDNLWHAGLNTIHAFEAVATAVTHAWDNVWHAGKNVVHFFASIPTYLQHGLDAVVGFFRSIPDLIIAFFKDAPTWLVDAGLFVIKGLFKGLVMGVKAYVFLIYESIKLLIKGVIYLFDNAPHWLYEAGKLILQGLWLGLKLQWAAIKLFFITIPKWILGFLADAASWLLNVGKLILRGMWQGLKLQWKVIELFFTTVPKWILKFFIAANEWLLKAGMAILTGLWHGLQELWNKTVGPFFASVKSKIAGWFTGAARWLINAGRNMISGLWNGLHTFWTNTVAPWFSGFAARITGYFTKAATWLLGAGGKVITGLVNGLRDAVHLIYEWFKGLPGRILGWLGIHSPPKWAVQAGEWIVKAVLKGAQSVAGGAIQFFKNFKGQISSILGAVGLPGGTGTIVGGSTGGSPSEGTLELQQFAQSQFGKFGWSGNAGNEMASLIKLWNQESGWRYNATNPTSGAYGIPQALPASKMGGAGGGPDWQNNPRTQIMWGLNYIKGRYGDPIDAWAHEIANNWYDKGAWKIPRDQIAMLHQNEMVVPASFAQAIRAMATGKREMPPSWWPRGPSDPRNHHRGTDPAALPAIRRHLAEAITHLRLLGRQGLILSASSVRRIRESVASGSGPIAGISAKEWAAMVKSARVLTADIKAFGNSLDGSTSQVTSAFNRMVKASGLAGRDLRDLNEREKHLINTMKERDAVTRQLAQTQAHLKDVQQKYKDEVSSVKQGVQSGFDITTAGNTATDSRGNPVSMTTGTIIQQIRAQVAQARKFAKLLKKLAKEGLSPVFIQQLAQAGPAAYNAVLTLADSTPAQLKEINSYYSQLGAAGTDIGKTAAGSLFGDDISRTKQKIKNLGNRDKALDHEIDSIGQRITHAIERELRRGLPHIPKRKPGDFEHYTKSQAEAIAKALHGVEIRFDSDGLARLITKKQSQQGRKGVRQ